jgi:hypothetical protein
MWFRWMVVWVVFLGGCGGREALVMEGEAMGMRWRVQVAGGEAAGHAAAYWADGQAAASGKASAAAEATQLAGVVRMHGERDCV